MTKALKILHLEDIASDAELVERALRKGGIVFESKVVDNEAAFVKTVTEFGPDIILSDHSLPSFNSLAALKILKEKKIDVPFILITSTISEEFAVNIIKEGASDYILKDRLQRLPNAIVNAIKRYQSERDKQVFFNKVVASEALFTKAEAIAEFGTWKVDLVNNIIDWSAGTYRLLGYEQNEVIPSYQNFLKNIHPDDKIEVEQSFKSAVAKGTPAQGECRILNKDNSIRYMRSQFEFEMDENGKPAFIIGFNQDITKSKLDQLEIQRHVEELKSASERQSSILNALPPSIVLLNELGKIIAVNESWRKFTIANNLGIPKYGQDYSYQVISEKATGVDQQTSIEIGKGIRDVIAGTTREFSLEYSCLINKRATWFHLIVTPLTDKARKGAVVLHIDVTDRKKAEEAMQQSEANLRTIFENTDVAYVLCNAEHKIISFNSKANELCVEQTGKSLRTGGNGFGFFPKNKIPNVKKAIKQILNNGMVAYETSYTLGEGMVKWYDVRWVGVADKNGMNIGFILAFKDITRRKLSDIERDKITADLVKRNKDLEQFTHIVSHNLRAPVANIMGLLNILNSFDLNAGESREITIALSDSVNILDNTINDLNQIMDVNNNVNKKGEEISLKALTEDVVRLIDDLIRAENVKINTDFGAVDNIFGIKSYMHSIFYNLLTNSVNNRRAEIDPVISIVTKRNNDLLEIIFKDNGKGIERKYLKDIFALYKKIDKNVPGKGIGLFITKMQVENLGGEIFVESEPGVGTTVKLEFPYTTVCVNV
ncbi:PAS domain S-box protein [Mucilaginibacter sp. L3T2-6]|uniref:PAS domain S-box protein n=1 Tax=Mucilaginibacter sp. L3T2-6 TaxID=3062491 RepID=UPI002676F1EA|nr:PAS domain S-box protein [Mucilaginibacter sp. L3T2-6]MDO3644011.1 PAS domain S-box protein [Mucilaginibacter sp. L3T2-6]MDV6216462.1 PAS domain S-box protein [Mucilaginibacter sp. L3T2-6]